MVSTSVLFLDVESDRAAALWPAAMDGYLAGLEECGWTIDDRTVRTVHYAASTSAALHWACTAAAFPYVSGERGGADGAAWVKRVFGCAPEELLERWAPIMYWLLDLGDQAREIRTSLSGATTSSPPTTATRTNLS